MPTPGLSLVGFMQQPAALNFFRQVCKMPDQSDGALTADWNASVARIGAAAPNAGVPDIQPIHPGSQGYIAQLMAQAWVQQFFAGQWAGAEFKLIEIAPLLAFQHSVQIERAGHHAQGLSSPPTEAELLGVCLPPTPAPEPFEIIRGQQSAIIKSPSLNLRTMAQGWFQIPTAGDFLGVQFGVAVPWVHVVRWAGKCFLHNGFHRAYGAMQAGATHIPCIFRDVASAEAAGIRVDGSTFEVATLMSANPPTLRHFSNGIAYEVPLKALSRAIHVSWAEYALPE